MRRLARDLAAWEVDRLTLEELRRRHGERTVEPLIALHERLVAAGDDRVGLARDWNELRRQLSQRRPEPAQPRPPWRAGFALAAGLALGVALGAGTEPGRAAAEWVRESVFGAEAGPAESGSTEREDEPRAEDARRNPGPADERAEAGREDGLSTPLWERPDAEDALHSEVGELHEGHEREKRSAGSGGEGDADGGAQARGDDDARSKDAQDDSEADEPEDAPEDDGPEDDEL